MSSKPSSHISASKRWFRNPLKVLFITILIGGIFFRFYGTPDRFGFDKDPTRDALVTLYGARHGVFPLVGPASGIASFTFGPWYYYELILFSMILPTPYAPFYFIPLFSVSLIILMYFIGKEIYDEYLGLILSAFSAFSPSFIGPASGLSNPNLVAPHVAGSILIFVLFLKKKGSWWLALVWGMVMGIGINNHYEMIPILLLPFIYFVLNLRKSGRFILSFLGGFILTFLPLIYFNISYNWYTLQGITKFVHSGGSNNYIPNNWHIYLLDFWPHFFGYIFAVPPILSLAVGGVVGLIYGYLIIKRKLSLPIILLGGVFLVIFLLLRYYNAERTYYYFIFLEPLLFIVVGFALRAIGTNQWTRILMGIMVLAFILISLPQNIQRTKSNGDYRDAQKTVALLKKRFQSQQFTIYTCQQKAIEKAQGVAFLLEVKRKLTENGQKIGFNNELDNCQLPDPSVSKIDKDLYNLYSLPENLLNKYGWYKISPETVYKNTVLWWTPQYEKI